MSVLASRNCAWAATLANRLVHRRAVQQVDARQRQQRQQVHHSRRQRQQAAEAAASNQHQTLQQTVPPQQQPAMYLLIKNEEALPCQQPSGAWLEAAPRGAYTTARTVGGDAVFELTFHLERLASSARLMMEADATSAAAAAAAATEAARAALADTERLRARLLAALRAAVCGYRAASADAAGELKITVLLTWAGCQQADLTAAETSPAAASNGADIFVHVTALPPRPQKPVRILVRGEPRSNAAAKDSEWVRQRKALEAAMPPGFNEVVLVGEGGALYEGLQSNFFAVVDGAVHTAGEGVLAGTVREVALAVARREGIPVVLQPPRLADIDRWEGCLISSTSRLLLPVDEASVPLPEGQQQLQEQQQQQREGAGGGPAALPGMRTRRFERGGLVQRLEQLVLAEVAACSEPLFT